MNVEMCDLIFFLKHISVSCVGHMEMGYTELSLHKKDNYDNSDGDSPSLGSTHFVLDIVLRCAP